MPATDTQLDWCLRAVPRMVDQFVRAWPAAYRHRDDLFGEARLAICEAAPRYDEARGWTFMAFGSAYARGRMAYWMRKELPHSGNLSFDYVYRDNEAMTLDPPDPEPLPETRAVSRIYRQQLYAHLSRHLTPLQCALVSGYYLEGRSQQEMAEERGVKPQGVCVTINRALMNLRRRAGFLAE